jgi:hypothetical protein
MLPNKKLSDRKHNKSPITRGKKATHDKNLIDRLLFNRIDSFSFRCARGTTHDLKILKKSKLEINTKANIKTDKGFIGIKELYPNAETPHKSSKYHPLSKEQKQFNRQLAKEMA